MVAEQKASRWQTGAIFSSLEATVNQGYNNTRGGKNALSLFLSFLFFSHLIASVHTGGGWKTNILQMNSGTQTIKP